MEIEGRLVGKSKEISKNKKKMRKGNGGEYYQNTLYAHMKMSQQKHYCI